MRCTSRIRINDNRIKNLSRAAVTALEQTAEALHTEVVQSQVMPFNTGNLQNESTFVDDSKSSMGKVSLISSTPYARRMYYHPEYHFDTSENPNAKGEWYEDWLLGGSKEKYVPNVFKVLYRRYAGL